MRILGVICVALLILSGCSHTTDETTRFHADGRAKPRIAILDALDNSQAKLPWNLSEEFTHEVTARLGSSGRLFIRSLDDLPIPLPVLEGKLSPFQDHSWLTQEQSDAEFYVFIELIEHSLEPRQKHLDNPSYDLIMSVRLKVVDVRQQTPRIVLQEFLEQTNYIPSQLANLDYHRFGYGKATFALSPIGMAHSKMTKKIASRLQDYILLAKSHS